MLSPAMSCRNWVRANIAPTRAKTESWLMTTAPVNARTRNSRTLIIGIGMRSCRTTNSASRASPATNVTSATTGSLPSARVLTP